MLAWLPWLSLAVALVAVAGSIALLAVRGLAFWRQVRASGSAAAESLQRLATSADLVATQAGSLDGGTEKLDAALSRLAVSRARLNVLLEAWSDVSASLGQASSYAPREKKA